MVGVVPAQGVHQLQPHEPHEPVRLALLPVPLDDLPLGGGGVCVSALTSRRDEMCIHCFIDQLLGYVELYSDCDSCNQHMFVARERILLHPLPFGKQAAELNTQQTCVAM